MIKMTGVVIDGVKNKIVESVDYDGINKVVTFNLKDGTEFKKACQFMSDVNFAFNRADEAYLQWSNEK